jgi:PadR family transcriptional regulator, regulatory protein AphA
MNTKTLCLGVLILGKYSGYDIGKQLELKFGHFMDVASSGVYPALKSLLSDGLVEYEDIEQHSLPDKKVYSITALGKETFEKELSELPPRHKIRSQYILLLYFAELLTEKRLEEVLLERLKEVTSWAALSADWIKNKSSEAETGGQQFIVEYANTIMTAEKIFLEKNASRFVKELNEPEK